MTGSKEHREAVEQLLQAIEENGWTVTSYNADVDPFTPTTKVSINVEL